MQGPGIINLDQCSSGLSFSTARNLRIGTEPLGLMPQAYLLVC